MSTVRVWLNDTEVDWSGFRTAGLPRVLRRPRRDRHHGRRGRALFAAAVIAAVGSAGAVAIASDEPARVSPPGAAKAKPAAAAPATAAERRALLTHIAACESDGSPTAVSPDGRYHGKYQFDLATWQSVGGTGNPAAAPEREQDRRAHLLLIARGTEPWPRCGPAAAGS